MQRAKEIENAFSGDDLPILREISAPRGKAALLYHPDLTDPELCFRIIGWTEKISDKRLSLDEIRKKCIYISETKIADGKDEAIDAILSGDAVLIFDKTPGYLVLNVRKYDKRSITEPPLSTVTYGPREGFIEDLKTNLCLIERRIRSPKTVVRRLKIGSVTKTDVAVVYIDGIADKKVVDKIVSRLSQIDTNGIIDVQYLQPYLEERPFSIFDQVGRAEKPDIVAAKILEGRVAVLVNGTPVALTLPYLFIESIQSSADYYQRFSYASFLRILRMITLGFAILLPGAYIALQKYHLNIIPLKFMLTVITALSGIPFRATTEMLFVILLFEIIRETGIRMPKAVGMAMSIVGALVLGETAVRAGIVSFACRHDSGSVVACPLHRSRRSGLDYASSYNFHAVRRNRRHIYAAYRSYFSGSVRCRNKRFGRALSCSVCSVCGKGYAGRGCSRQLSQYARTPGLVP